MQKSIYIPTYDFLQIEDSHGPTTQIQIKKPSYQHPETSFHLLPDTVLPP